MDVTRRRSVVGLALAGLAAALAVTGCSAGGNSGDASGAGRGDAAPAAAGQGEADQDNRAAAPAQGNAAPGNGAQGNAAQGNAAQGNAAQGNAAQGSQGAAPAQYRVDDRAIVFTGSITVRVADVDQAAARATTIATVAGGFVGADKRSSDDKRSEATLQLRVPAAKFGSAVDELAKLGKQESRAIDADDVTEEVVDLTARIASQQASVARTRALFNQARTISEIASVEAELAKRESELATLQARQRKLDDLTTLSTITATLLGPEAVAPKPAADNGDKSGFLAGLRTGWHGFLGALRVVLAILGFVLPFALVLGVPAGLSWWLLRTRRRRTTAPLTQPVPAVAAPGPAAGTAPPPPTPLS
jgi:hypothetical protein